MDSGKTIRVPGSWAVAERAFLGEGGTLHTGQALALGIHPRTLYAMRDAGVLRPLSRGVYRLATLPELSEPDLATAATRIPGGIICMISALTFHGITTQVPHVVDVAVPRGTRQPRLDYPPVRLFRFTGKALTSGVETHLLDGIHVRIYSISKTIADCFKLRNRIGLDLCIEALRNWRQSRSGTVDELLYYARVCRVETLISRYLEAIL